MCCCTPTGRLTDPLILEIGHSYLPRPHVSHFRTKFKCSESWFFELAWTIRFFASRIILRESRVIDLCHSVALGPQSIFRQSANGIIILLHLSYVYLVGLSVVHSLSRFNQVLLACLRLGMFLCFQFTSRYDEILANFLQYSFRLRWIH